MRSSLFAVMASASILADAQRVVKMPLGQKRTSASIAKRDPFAISMQNYIPYGEYFVTASVGTPAQEIQLIVDTGSSDIWMFGAGSCTPNAGTCEGGTFDASESTSLVNVPGGQGAFVIQYQTPGSSVHGNIIKDVFSVGGVSLDNLTMAVATRASQVPSGIMGIGLDSNEAAVSQGGAQYQNFPDELVAQGKIASKAYSLYLDDLATTTGNLLFGGYDEAKFEGDLKMIPFQRDDQTGEYTSFTVAWTSLGMHTSSGDFALENGDFLYGAVLDTGTTLTYLPTALYEPLFDFFNATYDQRDDITFVDCNIGTTKPGQLVYGLGGSDGPQIIVDFDELAVPIYSTETGDQLELDNGQPACQFGIEEAGDSYSILFGQTFLRSAYVLYDLDNLQAGIAQTIFDSTTSNIVEYDGRASTNRIESVSGPTVTYAASVPTVTGDIASFMGSVTGFLQSSVALGGAEASTVTTDFNLLSFTYPSTSLPASFPTTLSEGPTGTVSTGPRSTSNGGSSSGGSPSSDDASTSADTFASTGSPTPSASPSAAQSDQSGSNAATLISPTFATAAALMLALLTVMTML